MIFKTSIGWLNINHLFLSITFHYIFHPTHDTRIYKYSLGVVVVVVVVVGEL